MNDRIRSVIQSLAYHEGPIFEFYFELTDEDIVWLKELFGDAFGSIRDVPRSSDYAMCYIIKEKILK